MRMAGSEERQQAVESSVAGVTRRTTHNRLVFDVWFWLPLLLGSTLRLWAIDVSQFLDDQSSLMTVAREAVVRHALPIASIPSSINTLNPPLSIYLLMPFTLLGTNPLPAMIALALWNVLGIALCYVFASYFFERRIAALATLFFAVAPAAVGYSRFLWQQNYLPPLLILWAMVVYAGCVRGRRGMLAPAVALLALSAMLHATALLLAPTLIAGVLLAPHLPRLRDYVYSIAIVLLLLAPTVLWEIVSNWSDLRILTSYTAGSSKVDPEVFFRLYQALGGPGLAQSGSTPRPVPHSLGALASLLFVEPVTHPALGAGSPYAVATPLYIAVALLALLLFATGWLGLTRQIVLPALHLRRGAPAGSGRGARWSAWISAVWQGLRTDTSWRAHLLLWLMVTAPLVALLRHSSAIFTHYLIVLYPFAFLTMAIGVLMLGHGMALLVARLRFQRNSMGNVEGVFTLALVAVLVVGQIAQTALSTYSIASGQFDAAAAGYGYTLSSLAHADGVLTDLQQQVGAGEVYIAEKDQFSRPVNYMLVREHANRIGFSDQCLVLPPARATPTLVVVSADSQTARALARLTSATRIADIPMAGNSPLTVYRFTGALPTVLPGETALGLVRFAGGSGQGLELDGAQYDTNNRVRAHWTVQGATTGSAVPLSVRTLTRPVALSGRVEPMQGFRDCEPTRWETGATVLTWLPTPLSWRSAAGGPSETMLLQVEESTATLAMPSYGPVPLLTAKIQRTPWRALTPEPPNGSGNGQGALNGSGGGQGAQVANNGVALTKALLIH